MLVAAAYNLEVPRFSPVVLITLLVLLGVSAAVFVWQVRRWTSQPGWRALLDWSRERGFKLSRPLTPPGEPFDRFAGARVLTMLESAETRAMQLEVPPAAAAAAAAQGGAGAGAAGVEPS